MPGLYLWRMFVFLVLVGLLVAVLHQQLWDAMLNNLGLNVLICFVLLAGVLYAFQQVLRLYPEIRWVNAFRIADPGLAISHRPVLLSPMATSRLTSTRNTSMPRRNGPGVFSERCWGLEARSLGLGFAIWVLSASDGRDKLVMVA